MSKYLCNIDNVLSLLNLTFFVHKFFPVCHSEDCISLSKC